MPESSPAGQHGAAGDRPDFETAEAIPAMIARAVNRTLARGLNHDLDCAVLLWKCLLRPHPKVAAPHDELRVFPQLSGMIRQLLSR